MRRLGETISGPPMLDPSLPLVMSPTMIATAIRMAAAAGLGGMAGLPNVVWAFSRYRRPFGIDLRMAATIAGSALIATYPTARLATGLDPHVLRVTFALFLATIAATIAYHTWRGAARGKGGPRRAWGWITIVGAIEGAFSGFFGVGGAFVAPPLLTTFFGYAISRPIGEFRMSDIPSWHIVGGLVRQLQLRGSLPVHICSAAG